MNKHDHDDIEKSLAALVPAPAKLEGIGVSRPWRAEVDDLVVLAAAVVAGTVAADALLPNQDWLDERAKTMQQDLRIPGVTATNRPSGNVTSMPRRLWAEAPSTWSDFPFPRRRFAGTGTCSRPDRY